jgi:hypothetical protein
MSDIQYLCPVCHKQAAAKEGEPAPRCCGREMEPMPFCTAMPDPEQARNYKDDGPCNDGTSRPKR